MDPLPLIAAALVGGAILLLVIGVLGGSRAPIVERLEQFNARAYAEQAAQTPAQRTSMGQLISQSATLNALNRVVERRTWSDSVAREMARADLTLKPLEYLALRFL